MKLKDKFCNFLNGLVDSRLNNTKKVTTSYVALFLVLSIFAVSTFSWFTIRDTATIDSDPFSLESAAGMRVNKGEEIRNTITVKQAKLKEASSVDGRNMFFPVDRGYGDKGQSVDTSEMKFREGTVGDKNDGYIYSDFTLTGQTGGQVEVYVKSYKVEVTNKNGEKEVYDGATHITVDSNHKPSTYLAYQNPCPIRIAFIRNSAEASTVIDPTAIIDNYADECQAVSSVNSLGSATTTKAKGRSFSDYYFGTGAPLFTLDGLKSQNITMVAWLEATGENCDAYEGQDVSITVELESNWKDMEYVTFVDKTKGDSKEDENTELRWVGNAGCFLVMTYYDENFQNPKSVVMSESKSDGKKPIEWIAYLPKDKITNISFMRYSKVKEKIKLDGTNDVEVGRIYNVWHTTAEVNTWIDARKDDGKGANANKWSHEINKNGLQTYRTDDGTATGNKENTYYAVHGNGYGDTPTVAENVAPCIGYWGTKYANSSGGSVEPTTTEQLPITGETYARADIQIDYNLWLNEYNSYNGGGGLRNLLSQDVLVLKAVFNSNGTETAYEMKPQGGGDKCVLSKTSVKSGSRLVRFDLYDPAKEDPIIRNYLVPTNIQHTFTESAGSNEYIISYSLVNQGSGIVEKAGNW